MKLIGRIEKLFTYPVKSMSGVAVDQALLGWHGLVGDRRLGVRKTGATSSFPWLTASKLPELLLYHPTSCDPASEEQLPTHVRTPEGLELDIRSDELRAEIASRAGIDIELMSIKHGIFDDSVASIIASQTVAHVCQEGGVPTDSRRFRANIEVSCTELDPFGEDSWVGKTIIFGESTDSPSVLINKRDVRCKMIGLDPDTAEYNPEIVKTAVRLNENNAGVYATVLRPGRLKVGDPFFRYEGSRLPG
ncbi:MAG: MOSC N-terminal beta barrel domain-containing protein [Planctomycetota bacterium]